MLVHSRDRGPVVVGAVFVSVHDWCKLVLSNEHAAVARTYLTIALPNYTASRRSMADYPKNDLPAIRWAVLQLKAFYRYVNDLGCVTRAGPAAVDFLRMHHRATVLHAVRQLARQDTLDLSATWLFLLSYKIYYLLSC